MIGLIVSQTQYLVLDFSFLTPFLVDFYHLLITFANNLNPDQDQQNVSPEQKICPDLDPNCLTLDSVPEICLEKVKF